jgi:PleD family two-component response regulator
VSYPRLLLMAPRRDDLFAIGRALRDAGYLVFPARHHELAVDAVVRVRPDLVLIDADTFSSVQSTECRDAADAAGARVLLFVHSGSDGDAASMQRLAGVPYPVVEYSGDARALAGLIGEQ